MRKYGFSLVPVILLACALTSGSAMATNGYFTHGVGTKNKAMAGAGIAMPEDAIDMVNNPAVTTELGDQLIVGAGVFSPRREYRTSESQLNGQYGSFTIGPNYIRSDRNYFVIPHIARTWQRDNGSAWGVAFYGRGGMNTTWRGGNATFDPDGPGPAPVMTLPGTYGFGEAGVDLSQAFLDLNWAKKLNDRFSIGVSGILAAQLFEAYGVGTFAGFTETFAASGGTVMPGNLSNNGHEWSYGYGAKVGFHAKLSERVSMGLSYQTELKMTKFDKYADLFAQHGGFNIPPTLKFGLTFRPSEPLALSFDIENTWFGAVDSVGNSIALIFSCPTTGQGGTNLSNCLGGSKGAGFNWQTMTVYKGGLAWSSDDTWTWRLGYSYGKQPIPKTDMTFNILAPGVMESHITAGFTMRRDKSHELSVAMMYAPSKKLTGPQNFDPTQSVTFKMYEWELEASYAWRF
jgi:long-chain fatty acid transport protein